MMEFLVNHQLNFMQALSGICGAMACLLVMTKALGAKRRRALIHMELSAMFLLIFDRMAYIYAGDVSRTGYVMVRLSNFLVFFLTSEIVLAFNLYLIELLTSDGGMDVPPQRLRIVNLLSVIGMIMAVVAHFTGLYYYFDEGNHYHRGSGFLICYIIPIICPVIQFIVINQYRKKFSKTIFLSLIIYLIVPITASIIQIFAYGLSLTNMAMVLVSVFLYVFAYIDINETIERAHEVEMNNLKEEQRSARRLFDEITTSFVAAIDAKDSFNQGHSKRVAKYAERIAREAGKPEEECNRIYYAALLHDVGTIGIPDSIIAKGEELNEEETEKVRQKPTIGSEILSGITDYPYLKEGALYGCERYDGKGYPAGLKGTAIPEAARIVAVADAFDTMMSKKSYRDSLPTQMIREELVKGSGTQFDPEYSEIMVRLLDTDSLDNVKRSEGNIDDEYETEMVCGRYRGNIFKGIPTSNEEIKISFKADPTEMAVDEFSAPSIILFDAYDARVHDNAKAIEAYRYLEYAEIWFDGHVNSTAARNVKSAITELSDGRNTEAGKASAYEIIAGKFEDHLKLVLSDGKTRVEHTIALPDSTKAVYIGLTGEHCRLFDIAIDKTGKVYSEGDIARISEAISYIDRMESDLPNVQIDRTRSAATEGVAIKDRMRLIFHTMSLPTANLVWHCPYIVLFNSDDKKVFGPGYREYALIKLNGECTSEVEEVTNHFTMKKDEEFGSWSEWKDRNMEGMECEVKFRVKGNHITVTTQNLGISIEDVLTTAEGEEDVYVAVTGDQVALTDIRII
jgi:HD-GYP domain-containing protein (c-di-GMP phosphodiesterase class II)